jgi:hypothetical protein
MVVFWEVGGGYGGVAAENGRRRARHGRGGDPLSILLGSARLWQPGKERERKMVVCFLDSIISLSVFYFIDFLITLFLSFAFSRADLTSV